MAEILTESFCERCGTRYTFQSPPRSASPLGMLSTVGRGIRNYVAMPDASFNEAFAVARAETEQGATAHQLEAFQRTFNFCLSCRQYTCADCWNAVEGQCLSCSPAPESETRASSAMVAEAIPISIHAAPAYPPGPADLAWPPLEVEDAATVGIETDPEALAWAPEPMAEPSVVEEAVADDVAEPEAAAALVVVPVEAVAEAVEPEIEVAAVEPEAQAAVLQPEPAREQPEPAPEPPAPDTPGRSEGPPRPTLMPGFTPGVSLDEEIAAYDLRIAALAATAPASVTAPAAVARTEAHLAPLEAIPETPPETASGTPIGTCPSCGLSLSASARFCRRCGTQQHA